MKLRLTYFQVDFGNGPKEYVTCADIIGEFDVKDCDIVPGTYRPNRDYSLLNEEGFFQLTDEIAESLMVALDNLPDPDDPTPSWDEKFMN